MRRDANLLSLFLISQFIGILGRFVLFIQKLFFDVHILKGTPGLFSNPEVKLERVYGVVTWETSGEMCMTSNFPLVGIQFLFVNVIRKFMRLAILCAEDE